jgi:hypothetical protein
VVKDGFEEYIKFELERLSLCNNNKKIWEECQTVFSRLIKLLLFRELLLFHKETETGKLKPLENNKIILERFFVKIEKIENIFARLFPFVDPKDRLTYP